MTTTEANLQLEPCILTDKADTKTFPCRICGRPCVVNRFASAAKTECTFCRKKSSLPEMASQSLPDDAGAETQVSQTLEFDDSLEPEVLTDRDKTKDVPCRRCKRRCVVTTFATAAKVECNTCRGVGQREHKEQVLRSAAETLNPAKLENLMDGLINPAFRAIPPCPFDAEHEVELKYISHAANYGPRHLEGFNAKGIPKYSQETGESVTYQCNECHCVISYSTQHPMLMQAQNEAKRLPPREGPTVLETMLGERKAA